MMVANNDSKNIQIRKAMEKNGMGQFSEDKPKEKRRKKSKDEEPAFEMTKADEGDIKSKTKRTKRSLSG